jgi:uncharacterized membrane protein
VIDLESTELKIAKFLRIGVILSGLMMFAGWMATIKWSGDPFFNFQTYDQIPFAELIQFHIYRKDWGVLLSYSGLIVLISLPIIRVLMTSYLFIKQKEYLLATIALVVLSGLILSMLLGIDL